MNNPVNGEKLQLVKQIFKKITNNYGINILFPKICSVFLLSFLFTGNKDIFILTHRIFNLDK